MKEIGVGSIPWDLVESYVAQEDGAVAGIREEGGAVGQYRVVGPFVPKLKGYALEPTIQTYSFRIWATFPNGKEALRGQADGESLTPTGAVARRREIMNKYGQCLEQYVTEFNELKKLSKPMYFNEPPTLQCGCYNCLVGPDGPVTYEARVFRWNIGMKKWEQVYWHKTQWTTSP